VNSQYGTVLIPVSAVFYALFYVPRAPSDDKALAPVRSIVLLGLLVGDVVHVGNYLLPVFKTKDKEARVNKAGMVGNVGLTLVLACGRVAWLAGWDA